MVRREVALHEVLEFFELVREIVGTLSLQPPAQGVGGQLVATGRSAETQVDPARIQCGERAELFGHHHRCVVRQHDAAGSHPHRAGVGSEMGQQDGRRG